MKFKKKHKRAFKALKHRVDDIEVRIVGELDEVKDEVSILRRDVDNMKGDVRELMDHPHLKNEHDEESVTEISLTYDEVEQLKTRGGHILVNGYKVEYVGDVT